jgi:hypothetical protein
VRTADAGRRLAAWLRTAPVWPSLAVLCAVQLALAARFAFGTPHNHWLWYSGGDATEYWAASWSVAHGTIPQSLIGYGIPILYAWVPPLTGTTLLSGLPVIVVLQVVVLVPLALVLFFLVSDLLFGRLFAWGATCLWVVAPLLMLAGLRSDYATSFQQWFLAPHWYGLTEMADFPSVVAVLAAVWATLRVLETRALDDAVLAGVLAGVTIALKPSNGFLFPALAVLLVATRAWRPIVVFGASVVPSLVALTIWKGEGLGHLPLFGSALVAREALGAVPVAGIAGATYVHFDWSYFRNELIQLREVFWSVRFLEFLIVGGALGALRRSWVKGAFLVVWFGAYAVVKGSSTLASVTDTTYFRFADPGLPALVLLIAALVFLLPRRGRAPEPTAVVRPLPGGFRTAGAATAILAVLPIIVILALSPAATPLYARAPESTEAPLSDALAATTATSASGRVTLAWRRPATNGTQVLFVVYRSSRSDGCELPAEGAKACLLHMNRIGLTRETTFTDTHPGRGTHWYRIGLLANYRNDFVDSDLVLLGPASPS